MSRREQEAFTRVWVRLAGRSRLTNSEHETLRLFEKTWFAGDDFPYSASKVAVLRRFVDLADKYNTPVEFMRRPAVRRGQKAGEMYLTRWTTPEENGSCWPAYKKSETWEDRQKMKRDFRIRIMHDEMKNAGIYQIDLYGHQEEKRIAAEKQAPVAPSLPTNVVPLFGKPECERPEIDFEECPVEWRTYSYGMNDNEQVAA